MRENSGVFRVSVGIYRIQAHPEASVGQPAAGRTEERTRSQALPRNHKLHQESHSEPSSNVSSADQSNEEGEHVALEGRGVGSF